MAMKYWRLKLKGERSADEVQPAIGRSGGNVVRIHFEGGETHIYFAAEKLAAPKAEKAMEEVATPEEVSAGEVTKFS
jgi:hypothetical protein